MSEDLYLKSLEVKDGGIDMSLTGEVAKTFMYNLIEIFEANGGKNFLTMTFNLNQDKYAITIQNCNGVDSPSENLQRLTDENVKLKRQLEKTVETLTDVGHCPLHAKLLNSSDWCAFNCREGVRHECWIKFLDGGFEIKEV